MRGKEPVNLKLQPSAVTPRVAAAPPASPRAVGDIPGRSPEGQSLKLLAVRGLSAPATSARDDVDHCQQGNDDDHGDSDDGDGGGGEDHLWLLPRGLFAENGGVGHASVVAPSLTIDAGSDAASDIDVGGERPTRVGHGALQRACIGAVH